MPEDSAKKPPEFGVSLRLDLGKERIGPGKIRLLELVAETGSISAAGRAMQMSYRRAWLLTDALNHAFPAPLIETQAGGSGGGGAALTELGKEVIRRYRRLEAQCAEAAAGEFAPLLGPGG